MSFSSELWRMEINTLGKPEECFRVISKHCTALCKVHRCSQSDIHCLIWTNWSAPTVLTAESQRRQASVLSALCNKDSCHNLGLLLTPSFSNKRGHLWREEELARGMMTNNNVNTDVQFGLCFAQRNDMRDTRTALFIWAVAQPVLN